MNKRPIIYTNQIRETAKFRIGYNILRFSPAFFLYFGGLLYIHVTAMNAICFLISLVIVIYRLKKFPELHQFNNIIEMRISPSEIMIVTTKDDFVIKNDDIEAVALKQDGHDPDSINIYICPVAGAEIVWPGAIIEQDKYIKLPMIFEDHALDVLEEWDFLKDKCKNYQKIKHFVDSQTVK